MFAMSRSFAPLVLAVVALSGHATSGVVLAHVTLDHAVAPGHAHQPHGDDEHRDSGHGSDHSHELMPATPLAPARLASPCHVTQPCTAATQTCLGRPDLRALFRSAHPAPDIEPPEPKRHSILLL